jgi:hypothetical protein
MSLGAFRHGEIQVTELKADVRRIEGKVDAVKDVVSELRLDIRFKQVDESTRRVYASVEKVNASIAALALSTEKSFSRMMRWGIGVAAAILTVMAHGFKWI